MSYKNFFLFFFFLSSSVLAYAQNAEDYSYVSRDPRVDRLVEKHRQYNQSNPGVDGFRVQIFFDSGNNSKKAAQNARERFMESYPGLNAYLTYKSPYYRVRVGDFRTKLEAQGFLFQIATVYPNAFTVPDRVQINRNVE
ncbi:MAG: SPOR domain-containing protein [Bacteroidota bacterium]|nr:SPOR domain-containing protein [Bacteroidota bacterium]